jgi:hypothetical protein
MVVQLLHDCIYNAATAVHGCRAAHTSTTQHRHQPWFDTECRNKHKEVSAYVKFHPDNHLARKWKRQLKELLRRKKRMYKKLQGRQLCALAKTDPTSFWRQYSKSKERSVAISKTDLVVGFQKLLEGQCPSNIVGGHGSSTDQVVLNLLHPFASDDYSTLNCDITLDEIAQAMRRLRRNKVAGLDGIKAEFLLDAGDMLHVPLQIVFNKLLQQGYSASLSTGIIHALHKGDDALQFENYRGITMGPVLAKVFAMILEARLSNWAEERGLQARGQAGFRKDFRTTDNMYILRTLIEQSIHKRKKVYCYFVDFRKAFDTVLRDLLWQVLAKMGIMGRFMQCLQSMYSQDSVRVMHPTEGLSAQFPCGIGVKQGCPLSPLLFRLYLDGLEKHLDALDGDSPPQLANIAVKLLLYADDLALMSETPQGLQKQIDALSEFCAERQLVINVNKTKVVVFEKCRSAAPEFTYRGTTIERVQSFRYLGLELHSTRGMAIAIDKLTAVGKKALFALRRRCNDLSITDPEVMCQLFDSLVCPVLSYACEVWTGCTGAKRVPTSRTSTQNVPERNIRGQ